MNDIKSNELYCPKCGKLIKSDFEVCPYCKSDFKKVVPTEEDKKLEYSRTRNVAIITAIAIIIVVVVVFVYLNSCNNLVDDFVRSI